MHLIMNALEEVTSCVHPNVSEISLLITLVSASVPGLNLPKKSNKSRKLRWPTTVLITAFPFPLFRTIQVCLLPRLKTEWKPPSSLLHSYCGNLNGE